MSDRPTKQQLRLHEAMQRAYYVASRSPDPSTQNGACLLTRRGNETLAHNRLVNNLQPTTDDLRRRWTTHAEEGAIIAFARFGYKAKGSTLVCPWACCMKCATMMIRAGVKTLVVHDEAMARPSHWDEEIAAAHKLLAVNGIEIVRWSPLPGVPWSRPTLRFQGQPW